MRTVMLILALGIFVVPPTWGIPARPRFDDPQSPSVQLKSIRAYVQDGLMIPPGSECEWILVEASERLNRPLTREEIFENLPTILQVTPEQLVPESPPPSRPSPRWGGSCFTGEMSVATPLGPGRILDLKPGDELVSIDLVTRQPMANQIRHVRAHPGQSFGRLVDLKKPIDVTGGHRFLAQGKNLPIDFYAIGDLPEDSHLHVIDLSKPSGKQWVLVPRGIYICDTGVETVFDIEMVGEPRNFIVEGILVHNTKM